MSSNNPAVSQEGILPTATTTPTDKAQEKPKQIFTKAQQLLIPVAMGLGILFDRLAFRRDFWSETPFYMGIFWLTYLVLLYTFAWKRLRHNKILWLVAGCSAALCVWGFLYDYRSSFGYLNLLVVPAVLMAHAQMMAGNYRLNQVGAITREWLLGWVLKPFSAIPMFLGAGRSVLSRGRNSVVKRCLLGAALAVPLLIVIVPLLGQADMVFRFFLAQFIYSFNLFAVPGHLLLMAVVTLLFYSFLWNVLYTKPKEAAAAKAANLDSIVCCMTLGILLLLYLAFCLVQFTYLFARAGLPGDMTYSQYAREGFWQIIVVASINLIIFGVLLQYGKHSRSLSAMLAALLVLTGIMLLSAFVRLGLYIQTFGLTWLRLLSIWFLIYLAAVLVLCGVRMKRSGMPLVGVCALLLLCWYTTLGYASPDALIARYNLSAAANKVEWVENNSFYLRYTLSDNATLVVLNSDIDPNALSDAAYRLIYQSKRRSSYTPGYSYSSHRTARKLDQALAENPRAVDGAAR